MPDGSDLPIALRRPRRSQSRAGIASPSASHQHAPDTATPSPRRSRAKKRVRFSDPGPTLNAENVEDEDEDELATAGAGMLSTGLTPIVRRTSLLSSAPLLKRRNSTPAAFTPHMGAPRSPLHTPTRSRSRSRSRHALADDINEIRILPLRQVLDGRIRRRIKRNGLSEEMNTIHAQKKRRAREAREKMHALRRALEQKDAEIQRLQSETAVIDMERMSGLEREVENLKEELAARSRAAEQSQLDQSARDRQQQLGSLPRGRNKNSTLYNWTAAARDPFTDNTSVTADDDMDVDADGFPSYDHNNDDDDDLVYEDEHFGNSTMADLACSTPNPRVRALIPLPTPPATSSPAGLLMTPASRRYATPKSEMGIQAEMPDPEKEKLREELSALQKEIDRLTSALGSYSGMAARVSENLMPFASQELVQSGSSHDDPASSPSSSLPMPSKHQAIEPRISALLMAHSDKTAALADLSSAINSLGFPGTDPSVVLSSLSAALRTARLELEYLSPGEITIPLTNAGASVLELLITRLRDLARRKKEADESIDEYHAIEQSLRKQLAARVDAMDAMNAEMQRTADTLVQRDAEVAELRVGLEHMKGAVGSYERDLRELEQLVERMEADAADGNVLRDEERARFAEELDARTTAMARDLQERVAESGERVDELRAEMEELRASHARKVEGVRASGEAELARLNEAHARDLARRDAQITELRGEIERLGKALKAADEAARQLRALGDRQEKRSMELAAQNTGLKAETRREKRRAQEVAGKMRVELLRFMRTAEDVLDAPSSAVEEAGEKERGVGNGLENLPLTRCTSQPSLLSSTPAGAHSYDTDRTTKRRRYDSGLGFLDEEELADM